MKNPLTRVQVCMRKSVSVHSSRARSLRRAAAQFSRKTDTPDASDASGRRAGALDYTPRSSGCTTTSYSSMRTLLFRPDNPVHEHSIRFEPNCCRVFLLRDRLCNAAGTFVTLSERRFSDIPEARPL